MRFGVVLGLYEPQLGLQAMIRRAQTAEQLGYDSLWAGDHIVIPNVVDQTPHYRDVGGTYPEGSEYLEPITLLSFLAGQTRSINGWMREEFEVLRTPPYSERGSGDGRLHCGL
jgi:alkanesulfonate monooxygenase SsuD/methylene tetrahydromethanopterin reductase-like flavin-dependent oxidoreductase (luciferase family)